MNPFEWTDWVGECEMPTTGHSCMCHTWQWVTVTLPDINTAEHTLVVFFSFSDPTAQKSQVICAENRLESSFQSLHLLINHENNHVHCCYITHISIHWKVWERLSDAVIGALIQKSKKHVGHITPWWCYKIYLCVAFKRKRSSFNTAHVSYTSTRQTKLMYVCETCEPVWSVTVPLWTGSVFARIG